MDLEEWELIPDDGFLEIHDDGGKKIYSRKYGNSCSYTDFNMNYFICPSPKSTQFVETSPRLPKQLVPVPIQLDHHHPAVSPAADHQVVKQIIKIPAEITTTKAQSLGAAESDQESVSQVFFKKMEENEFVDMKMDSPKSGSRRILPQIETGGAFLFEERSDQPEAMDGIEKEMINQAEEKEAEEEITPWEEGDGGLDVLKWGMNGIGAICSFGFAAATICIIFLGSGKINKPQQQKLRFQIYADDKRMKHVVHHATRPNEAISSARGGGGGGVPLTRAHITFGGYYDGF